MTSLFPAVQHVPAADLAEIVREVWGAYLASEPFALDPGINGTLGEGSRLTGVISISGAWTGVVTLTLPADLARAYTARLLMLDAVALSDADVTDAVGELINIIGGNVKAQLPEPSALSMPVVTHGEATLRTGTLAQTAVFIADDRPFTVTITTEAPRA